MTNHPIAWTSPTPLWGRFAEGSVALSSASAFLAADQSRPAILRFATDEFMDQLLAALAQDPRQLGTLLARPETWRNQVADGADLIERIPVPRLARSLRRLKVSRDKASPILHTHAEADLKEQGRSTTKPLKLYQPAHQRFYLVAANLVCSIAGFPDRAIATGGREQVGFVLRRLLPPKTPSADTEYEEYAFLKSVDGARWQRVAEGAPAAVGRLLPGEELLPLFPLKFNDDLGRPRRLHAGLIPVGRREEYMGATVESDLNAANAGPAPEAAAATPVSAHKEQFRMEVAEPWKNLIRTAFTAAARINEDPPVGPKPDPTVLQKTAEGVNNQLQGQSWLILLDFADYLQVHLPEVWACVRDPGRKTQLNSAAQRRLFDWIDGSATAPTPGLPITANGTAAASLRDALRRIGESEAARNGLEQAVRSYPDQPGPNLVWPDFMYLLAAVGLSGLKYAPGGPYASLGPLSDLTPPPDEADPATPPKAPEVQRQAEAQALLLDKLVQLVVVALGPGVPQSKPAPLPYAVRLRDALSKNPGDPGWFALRCVYVRCDCGPLHPPEVSSATQRFQLASFFDPDAPARPIRISLPLDTTPAGLRKFNKNTAFVLSDVLCGQVQRAKGLGFVDLVRQVLPFPLHKDIEVGGMGPCQSSPSLNIGMICSLSIPIITLCALILLMIIVSLLDFIFRWMPYFIMCFPLPKFGAKK